MLLVGGTLLEFMQQQEGKGVGCCGNNQVVGKRVGVAVAARAKTVIFRNLNPLKRSGFF
jgi:hypothetical protein